MRKLLSILFLVQMKRIQLCLSLDIIRGERDKFSNYISSSVEDIDSGSCDKDDGYCTCDKDALYNTFIYDSTSSTGRCVTNENILLTGCYEFFGISPMVLVDEGLKCEIGVENAGCSVQFSLSAPSNVQHQSCKLQKEESQYSVYGHTWLPLKVQPGEFSLNEDTQEKKFLKIANKASLLSKWPGTLLRLQIKCSSGRWFESHCVLLKIAGSPENIPSVSTTSSTSTATSTSTLTSTSSSTSLNTSPTTSSTTTSIQDNKTKDSNNLNQGSDKDSSTLISIVVPIAVLLCLLIVVIGIVLYRRRQRSTSKQGDTNLYEESNLPNNPRDGSYNQGEFQNFYETPSDNKTNPTYDYATRGEIVPTSPENRSIVVDHTSSSTPSQSPGEHNYQTIDNNVPGSQENGVDSGGNAGKPSPLYHTLEDNGGRKQDDRVYEAIDENQGNEPVYNVLEGPV